MSLINDLEKMYSIEEDLNNMTTQELKSKYSELEDISFEEHQEVSIGKLVKVVSGSGQLQYQLNIPIDIKWITPFSMILATLVIIYTLLIDGATYYNSPWGDIISGLIIITVVNIFFSNLLPYIIISFSKKSPEVLKEVKTHNVGEKLESVKGKVSQQIVQKEKSSF